MSTLKTNSIDDAEIFEETDLMGSMVAEMDFDTIDIEDDDEIMFDEDGHILDNSKPTESKGKSEQNTKKDVKQPQQTSGADIKNTSSEKNKKNRQEKLTQTQDNPNYQKEQYIQERKALEQQQQAMLEEAIRRETEAQRRAEDLKRREEEFKYREEVLKQKEEEIQRKEREKVMGENQEYNTDNRDNTTQDTADTYSNNAYQQARNNNWEDPQQAQTEPVEDDIDEDNIYDPDGKKAWSGMNHIMQNGRFGKILKKGLILLVSILLCIAIPVTIIMIGGKITGNGKDKQTAQESTQPIDQMINVFGDRTTESDTESSVITEQQQSLPNDTTATAPVVTVKVDTPQVETGQKNLSSRFPTLEDLTLYVNSSTATILMNEKQAMNNYVNGNITKEECLAKLQTCTAASNEVLHLLVVNKKLYTEQGQAQQYTSLEDDLISVMYYGDVATSLMNSDATIPQIIQSLNMQ